MPHAQYNFQGALTSLNILGQTETRQYNTLGQLTRIQGVGINIEYQFSTTANDGKITGQKNWATGEEVTYQYDALERLISAATVSNAWGLSWSYDGFGNRLNQNVTKGTAPSMSTLVDANTNRLSGFGYSYDNNGNLLTMPQQSASMAYDASNRMVTFTNQNDTESYQYAPDNKRVWRSKGCPYQSTVDGSTLYAPIITFYSVFGQKMGDYCHLSAGWKVVEESFYFGGRKVAKTDEWNTEMIVRLTTDRLHSKGDGSTFFPYGETKSGNPITGDSFATYSRDWTGLDYADQRWYAPGVGRFTTVDPLENVFDLKNPLTQNRFSYVIGDPVNYSDNAGLGVCPQNYQVSMSFGGITYITTYIYHCYDTGYIQLMSGNSAAGDNKQTSVQYVGYQQEYESGFCTTVAGLPCYQVDLAQRYWSTVGTSECTVWMAMAEECDEDAPTATASAFMLGARRSLYFGLGFRGLQFLYSTTVGRLAERTMAELLKLPKNNGQFKITDTLSGRVRIPDFFDGTLKAIYEVKNVASISLTPQIRDMASWASQNGYSFTLYVRRNAAGVEELRRVGINVIEMDFVHEE